MKWWHFIILAGGMLLFGACTPKNVFVLMPGTDGAVGSISVKNKAGEQVVTSAATAVKVKDAHSAPDRPSPISEKKINKIFGRALDATPSPPAQFILRFRSGTAQLTETSRALLPQISASVKKRQPCDIRVIGHTDTVGEADKNWALALKRAEAIKQILIDQGIDANQIEAVSHGENNLLIRTPDGVDEPRNRRVEVLVR